MRRREVVDYLVYLAVRVVLCVVQAVPLATCERMSRRLAWLCWDVLRVRRRVVEDNLRHAFSELTPAVRDKIGRDMWEHLFLLAIEMAHASRKVHWTNWRDYVCLVRKDLLVHLLLDDRPVVMVSAHFGNFELSGYVLGILGFPSFTIARPLDNRYLHQFINRVRGATGQFIFPKTGSAQQVDALLAHGATLTLLVDQHAGAKGCWVDFFGRPASTHKAIALFSLANDAPMVVCYCQRDGKALKHNLGAEHLIDPRTLSAEMRTVPEMTQWFTNVLETIIRRAPEQYWWVHDRWKGKPPRKQTSEIAA